MRPFRELKYDARRALSGHWGVAVLVALLAGLLGGGGVGIVIPTSFGGTEDAADTAITPAQLEKFKEFLLEYLPVILAVAAGVFVVALVYAFLVSNVLRVGYARFNLDLTEGRHPMVSTLFEGFHNWWAAVRAMGLMSLIVFLKCLLFVVPGILAAFDYAMVPYIMAENPRMKARDALARSKYMMRGYRWKFFLLELSFIGWILLAVLAYVACALLLNLVGMGSLAGLILAVGMLLVGPYIEVTLANFYLALPRPEEDDGIPVIKASKVVRALKITAVSLAVVFYAFIAFSILSVFVIIPNHRYQNAIELMEEGKYAEAIAAFEEVEDYKDSQEKIKECLTPLFHRTSLAVGGAHTVVLHTDGTVSAVGENHYGQCDVSKWRDIVAISAGDSHTVGLRSDGTVVAVGSHSNARCSVYDWSGIVAISAGSSYTMGLRYDGTVVIAGWEDVFEHVDDVVALGECGRFAVAVLADGTVEVAGDDFFGETDVSHWSNIVAIAAGQTHTVGLRSNGTVVATGEKYRGQCDVSEWRDIVAVSAGFSHTVGLRSDGTVVATGPHDYGECATFGWKNIVAIAAGEQFTVGLRSDGTLVAVGKNHSGQCNVSGLTNIRLPE